LNATRFAERWVPAFAGTTSERAALAVARKFQNIKPDPTIDHVDQTALVERHVVALRRGAAGDRLRDEMADLLERQRIGDVDDAQAAGKPDRVDDRARDALAELMRPEARAAGAAERRIHLAHLELAERPDGGRITHVEGENAGMRAAAPRLLFAGALGLILLV